VEERLQEMVFVEVTLELELETRLDDTELRDVVEEDLLLDSSRQTKRILWRKQLMNMNL